jgi:hypothetical protein
VLCVLQRPAGAPARSTAQEQPGPTRAPVRIRGRAIGPSGARWSLLHPGLEAIVRCDHTRVRTHSTQELLPPCHTTALHRPAFCRAACPVCLGARVRLGGSATGRAPPPAGGGGGGGLGAAAFAAGVAAPTAGTVRPTSRALSQAEGAPGRVHGGALRAHATGHTTCIQLMFARLVVVRVHLWDGTATPTADPARPQAAAPGGEPARACVCLAHGSPAIPNQMPILLTRFSPNHGTNTVHTGNAYCAPHNCPSPPGVHGGVPL